MSLDWELGEIENYRELCWWKASDPMIRVPSDGSDGYRLNPVTDALIWECLALDMNRITEKNVDQFYARMKMSYAIHQHTPRFSHLAKAINWMTPHGEWDGSITKDMIRAHVGLSTNVTQKTDAQWMKKEWAEFTRRTNREK